jgi:hypothetical protein
LQYELLGDGRVAAFRNDFKKWPPANERAFVVTGHSLQSLLGGEVWYFANFHRSQLLVLDSRNGSFQSYDAWGIPAMGIYPSTDGRYLAFAEPMPAEWTGHCWRRTDVEAVSDIPGARIAVLDLTTGSVARPFGGPLAGNLLLADYGPLVTWSGTGTEAIASFTFVGSDECGASGSISAAGQAAPGAYIFSPGGQDVQLLRRFAINQDGEVDYFPLGANWDVKGQHISLTLGRAPGMMFRHGAPPKLATPSISYLRSGTAWRESKGKIRRPPKSQRIPRTLLVRQDYNELPRLCALSPSGRSRDLFDLAPLAHGKALGTVEVITWNDQAGTRWRGLLAVPGEYSSTRRLPLIIQTHGKDTGATFFSDGTGTSAFPGRAALLRGFAVLVVYDLDNVEVLTGQRALEPARMVEGYRSAVAHLDSLGVADPARIGAMGWSRSSYYVKYGLTHSPKLFAAAVVTDGVDYGYGQYLMSVDHVEPAFSRQYLVTYGAVPWKSWQAWVAEAPGFNLQNVQAPVRIEANSSMASVLNEWEFYAGMRRRGLPVDLIVYPDGDHPLVRPYQRMLSAEGALDWLDYWLNGHVDPTDAKKPQYARWDQMRSSGCTDSSHPMVGEAGRDTVTYRHTVCD